MRLLMITDTACCPCEIIRSLIKFQITSCCISLILPLINTKQTEILQGLMTLIFNLLPFIVTDIDRRVAKQLGEYRSIINRYQ
jgi:hypothetical protein